MNLHADHIVDRFCVVGINYRNANTAERGLFTIPAEQQPQLLQAAMRMGFKSIFLLCTCNRTELYGYTHNGMELAHLLTSFSQGSLQQLLNLGYSYSGKKAIGHLFRVAAGLDSQIIGDCEIKAQLKKAVALSRQQGLIGPVMDRTLNFAFQASKAIRASTALSTGVSSVSYAAIEWVKKRGPAHPVPVLVVGTGKFGANICKNIISYLNPQSLTICNRTPQAAHALAGQIGASVLPYEQLASQAHRFAVIFVCTAAPAPVLLPAHLVPNSRQWIIDLSVPANVHPAVASIAGVQLANIDMLTQMLQHTLSQRQACVPAAMAIIAQHQQWFYNWLHTYRQAPAIRYLKAQLKKLIDLRGTAANEAAYNHQQLINTTVEALMLNIRRQGTPGCHIITAYAHFLTQPIFTHP